MTKLSQVDELFEDLQTSSGQGRAVICEQRVQSSIPKSLRRRSSPSRRLSWTIILFAITAGVRSGSSDAVACSETESCVPPLTRDGCLSPVALLPRFAEEELALNRHFELVWQILQ